ncbi:uncharacterized protein TNIN_149651 [Trichonephila inaurata madagascariensis]|uniref:Uncharacterized protein n=1 Tax=Trichonephila inaurata madagascariensis TaxID=2747483 RepID=A0A8X6X4M9_9ARAC|nr:uncharacterized protein TNIN_149651 [Trichonephila inaurata madagascariensis]
MKPKPVSLKNQLRIFPPCFYRWKQKCKYSLVNGIHNVPYEFMQQAAIRIAQTGDLIQQGVTGLEPALSKVQNLHSVIVASSGKETPKEMEDHFKLTDHQANSMFSYLEELLKMVHHTQYIIDDVRDKNKSLLINLSDQERRLRWEIKEMKVDIFFTQSLILHNCIENRVKVPFSVIESVILNYMHRIMEQLFTDQKNGNEVHHYFLRIYLNENKIVY